MTRVQKSHGFRMIGYCLMTAAGHCDARLMLVLGHPTPPVMRTLFQPRLCPVVLARNVRTLPVCRPPVFSGSARDGGYIFVPTLGMPTPPLVHVEPTMTTSSPTLYKDAVQIEQILVEGLRRSRCPPAHTPIAGPVMVCNSSTLPIFLSYLYHAFD